MIFGKKAGKVLLIGMALVLLISAVAFAEDGSSWADSKLNYLKDHKVIDAMPSDINYKVDREEFFVMTAKAWLAQKTSSTQLPFVDLQGVSAASLPYLQALYDSDILQGELKNGQLYLNPDGLITRQEVSTILGRALQASSSEVLSFTDEGQILSYAYPYIARLTEMGIVNGYPDGSFLPFNNITIGESATLLYNIMQIQSLNQNQLATYAGSGLRGFTNGALLEAQFTMPLGLAMDNDGSLIVLDTNNAQIRKIKNNQVSTVAGLVKATDFYGLAQSFYVDTKIDRALFARPTDAVTNAAGELLIVDRDNSVIRWISDNRVYTFSGSSEGYKDGERKTAQFNHPTAIATADGRTFYVADTLNNCIRMIDSSGKVTTVAGVAGQGGCLNGAAEEALFCEPSGIAVGPDGAVYVADTGNHRIRKIADGQVTTVAGGGDIATAEDYPLGSFRDATGILARFNFPSGLCFAGDVLIIADSANHSIRVMKPDGEVLTIAGSLDAGYADGAAREATLNSPNDVVYQNGKLYIADSYNNKIRVMAFNPNNF